MTNFSGIGRQGLWSWLTPERAVLVVPVIAGLGLSLVMISVGITPLTMRVRQQAEVVERLMSKAEFVPMLQQQSDSLKNKQKQRDRQLDRLLGLVAGTSELQTFLAELNDLGRLHNVGINITKPGVVERFKETSLDKGTTRSVRRDPLLNRGLEKRSAALTVTGSFAQVLAFLQALEELEVFVVISDMNIRKQIRKDDGRDQIEVSMNLTMTAYGRQSQPRDSLRGDES